MSILLPDGATVIDFHTVVGDDRYSERVSPNVLLRAMDASGVDVAVVGATGRWAAVDNEEGNRELATWRDRFANRFQFWATINAWYGIRGVDEFRRSLENGAVGLQLVPGLQGGGLLSPHVEPLLEVALERSVPVYVVTGVPVASEPLQLTELARRHPGIVFVMGRSGRTDFSLDLMPALEAVPNIIAETAYNGSSLINDMVRVLGADRVVLATDAPNNDISLELARIDRAGLTEEHRRAVLGGSVARILQERSR